ncbi:hypothetical protein GM418_31365 [Maribellus comscasis]|uniref:PKD domain-containing protein n=1 Tax=Maribellus comscasis TaxID=2681766 RepID=A0A6I6JY87_9BACT|nr:hypothetical protein [Maribellus comscasis]QGY47995.1 hypothetical protein GM418_31365 [Maribellus comscasis]
MKHILFSILFMIIYSWSFGQSSIRYTPTGDSVNVEHFPETFSLPIRLAADTLWVDSIIIPYEWYSAEIIGSCTNTYNCHGYAWHLSDGGDTVRILSDYDAAKYYTDGINGGRATYKRVNSPVKYGKVNYYGASHSGIVDSINTSKVISKWGSGPLVRHNPYECEFGEYTTNLEYYELIIDSLPTSVAKGCATDVTTLDINNATYNWADINSYVCASGNTYTGEVTGLNTTPGVAKGKVKVEITSPYSNTTVKGIKELSVTAQPTGPTILESTTKVCSGGTSFTLNNVSAGNTVTWTSSSNINIPNPHINPCTFYSTGNGSGWIKASVSTGCAQDMFPDVQKSVWSGVPVISYISGPTSTPNNQWATYNTEPYNSLMTYSDSDYHWTLNPLNGNSLHNYGHTLDIAFYNSGNYQLVVYAENTCGTGHMLVRL